MTRRPTRTAGGAVTGAGSEPGLQLLLATAVGFRVGLRGSFRGVRYRDGLVVPGPAGWGEFAPFADYSAERAGRWLAAALEAAYVGWPDPVRESIPVNAIIPVRPVARTRELTEAAVTGLGCRTIKLKVADPAESGAQEESRVAVVREVLDELLGPGHGRIRLDANGGWSVATARDRLDRLSGYGIEYVEQPCRSVPDLVAVREHTTVPVAVDETIRIDGAAAGVAEYADVAVLKAMPLGGVSAALRVAEQVGVPVVVSGSMDTSLGLAAAVALAAALPDLHHDCGLATGTLLAEDLLAATTLPVHGQVPVVRSEPDPDQLAAASSRLGPTATGEWLDRLVSAWEFVPAEIRRRVVEPEPAPGAGP